MKAIKISQKNGSGDYSIKTFSVSSMVLQYVVSLLQQKS